MKVLPLSLKNFVVRNISMIISISGVPGSGKTSAGKLLAAQLGYTFYSTGGLFRKMAEERGMTINELMKLGESDITIHKSIDEYQRVLGKEHDNFVIEGRLSWHFIPHSFKVLLLCDTYEAAKRTYEAKRAAENDRRVEVSYQTIEETEKSIIERNESDILGYQKHYGINYLDPQHFDAVIDTTTSKGAEETAQLILKATSSTNKI